MGGYSGNSYGSFGNLMYGFYIKSKILQKNFKTNPNKTDVISALFECSLNSSNKENSDYNECESDYYDSDYEYNSDNYFDKHLWPHKLETLDLTVNNYTIGIERFCSSTEPEHPGEDTYILGFDIEKHCVKNKLHLLNFIKTFDENHVQNIIQLWCEKYDKNNLINFNKNKCKLIVESGITL